MNAYYRTWDSLTAEQKATETASQAQALYANGRPAEGGRPARLAPPRVRPDRHDGPD